MPVTVQPARPRPDKPRPDKPRADFPLFAHDSGQWAKKILGRTIYFGAWSDPAAALARYLAERDDLYAGRRPGGDFAAATLEDLCDRFLSAKEGRQETGELSPRTVQDYTRICGEMIQTIGRSSRLERIGPRDFERLRARLAKRLGPSRLGIEIQRCRSVFRYGHDEGLLENPVRFGPGFKAPPRKSLRKVRNERGKRMFEPGDVLRILEHCDRQFAAMVLLGVNCGFGNTDVAVLAAASVDLEGGWVNHPRPKTEIVRRCPLWPETIAAIREHLVQRQAEAWMAGRTLFGPRCGGAWDTRSSSRNPISQRFRMILDAAGVRTKQLNFYGLRHTFETIAGDSGDQVATDAIMGHAPDSDDMAAVYREAVFDDRLRAAAEHVRKWLGIEAWAAGRESISPVMDADGDGEAAG